MNISNRIQRAIIRSSPYPPFRWIYGAAYGAMLLWLMIRVRRIPAIRYLELRAPRKGHRFGSSDLDVRAETKRLGAAEMFALHNRLADVLQPSSRWKRILDFYIFGPAEAKLQRRLGPISFGESRWIRLIGPKAIPDSNERAAPPLENGALCRAMYEYGCLSQELFEGSPKIHFAWTLYRRITRIDDGFGSSRGILDTECALLRDRVTMRADSLMRGGPLREVQPSEMEELFALALSEVNSISETTQRHADAAHDSNFRSIVDAIPPDNLSDAIGSCASAVTGLCERLAGHVQGAILGCVPATTFDYRIYLIVRDGLGRQERAEVFRAIREIYAAKDTYRRIPNTWLRLRHPMVLTPSMWRASSRWYHALRPVEEFFFFKHHGVVLWGKDLRDELDDPAPLDVIRSAAISVSDLRNGIWGAVHSRRPRQLVDALLGRIPALWLLLARSTIATTPPEALAGCAAAGFPLIPALYELRNRLAGLRLESLPGTDDAAWKPALEASSIWIDEIAAMALTRLESDSEAATSATTRLSAGSSESCNIK